MSDPKAQQEPTMEEILASIRKIISENDDQTKGAATSAPNPANSDAAAGDNDVLELTDVVTEDGTIVSLNTPFEDGPPRTVEDEMASGAEDDAADSDDADEVDADTADADEDVADEIAMGDPADEKIEFSSEELIGRPAPAIPLGGLISEAAASATAAAFAALARNTQQIEGGGMALGNGRTLEELVQEMMRPMIKEWLDKNLPAMTERLVRKELERLSRRAED